MKIRFDSGRDAVAALQIDLIEEGPYAIALGATLDDRCHLFSNPAVLRRMANEDKISRRVVATSRPPRSHLALAPADRSTI
jgi:hypothetical protein